VLSRFVFMQRLIVCHVVNTMRSRWNLRSKIFGCFFSRPSQAGSWVCVRVSVHLRVYLCVCVCHDSILYVTWLILVFGLGLSIGLGTLYLFLGRVYGSFDRTYVSFDRTMTLFLLLNRTYRFWVTYMYLIHKDFFEMF